MSIFRFAPVDAALIAVARKGYRWYLALKVLQALLLPVALVVWLAYVAASVVLIPLIYLVIECCRVVLAIPEDFRQTFARRKWLSGFSRTHYASLDHYKGKRGSPYKPQTLPPEDA